MRPLRGGSREQIWGFLSLLYLVASLAVESVADKCVPYPIAAKIGNVTLSNGQVARGVAYSVGSPKQDFAFLPQWPYNNILLYGTDGHCTDPAPLSEQSCTTWRGGRYDKVASRSRKVADPDSYPDDPEQYPKYPDMDFISDTLTLNKNVSLENVPMGIALASWREQGYAPMMSVGMGANSSILNALTSAGSIISRSWSMFYGWTGDSAQSQLDGTFVFGGYDRAKVSGRGYTVGMTDNEACSSRLMVTVEDMAVNFPNGTTASLFKDHSSSFAACILPDYPVLMTIPLEPYFEQFQKLTNATIEERSFGPAFFSMIYGEKDQPFEGDITFSLQSGPSIRIPNDQLVVSERTVDPESGEIKANASARNLLMNSIQAINAKDLPKLGRQFLSSAYVLVNEDVGDFTIWPSNPTNDVDIVAIDKKGEEVMSFCGQSETTSVKPAKTTSPATAETAASDTPETQESSSLSMGAIIGISVGTGFVGVAIAAGVYLCWWRRRKRSESVQNKANSNVQRRPEMSPPDYSTRSSPFKPVHSLYLPAGSYKPELQGSAVKGPPSNVYQHYELPG